MGGGTGKNNNNLDDNTNGDPNNKNKKIKFILKRPSGPNLHKSIEGIIKL
jgi:hypothetical protein